MRPGALAIGVLLACALAGCSGYHWKRYNGALGDVRTVAIQPITNHSYEAGAEALVNDALLREFQGRGDLRVVKDPKHADLVLTGTLFPLSTRARSFSSVAFALEYEVVMNIDLSARRANGTVIRFGPGVLTAAEIYLSSSDIEVQRKNRQEALRRISVVIAGRVHDALGEKLVAAAAAPAAASVPAPAPATTPGAAPAEPAAPAPATPTPAPTPAPAPERVAP